MIKKLTGKLYLDNFLLGILAGLAIARGGTFFLLLVSIGQKFWGAVSFCTGLLTICYLGFHLYTGKIGYLLENKRSFIISLFFIYLGNVVGAVGAGYLVGLIPSLKETVTPICYNKLISWSGAPGQSIVHMLAMSFFCGNLVFLCVDMFRKNKNHVVKVCGILVCITTFVMMGMEHCIANMFYFAVGNMYGINPLNAILSILVATLGNSLGSILLYIVVNNSTFRKIL